MSQKVYLDANVLIAHQVNNHEYHQQAVKLLDDLWKKGSNLLISSLTVDEFFYGVVFILRSLPPSRKSHPFSTYAHLLRKSLSAILTWEGVELVEFQNNSDELLQTVTLMEKYNLRPRDAFHLRIMQQQETNSFVTFDQDFNDLGKVEKINILS